MLVCLCMDVRATTAWADLNVREYFDLKRSSRFCVVHISPAVRLSRLFYSIQLLLCTTELRVHVKVVDPYGWRDEGHARECVRVSV